MGIEPGRDQNQLGSIFESDGFKELLKDISIFRIARSGRKGNVYRKAQPFSLSRLSGCSCTWIEETVTMGGEVEDPRVFIK